MSGFAGRNSLDGNIDGWIYHELQQAALCGQHALNNLLQGPYFSADDLATIAHQLDEMERRAMLQNSQGHQSQDYLRYLAEGSGNVDAAGNFSIQVLRAALEHELSIQLVALDSDDYKLIKRDITEEEGFICNKQAHWFSIRLINDRFWNLNSTAETPVAISHFNLASTLASLKAEGYSVFVARGPLPPAAVEVGAGNPSYWWKLSDLLAGRTKSTATTGDKDPWRNVKGSGNTLSGGSSSGGNRRKSTEEIAQLSEEELLQMAMEASLLETKGGIDISPTPLGDEPPNGPDVIRIQVRLERGRAVRRFRKDDKIKILFDFAASEIAKLKQQPLDSIKLNDFQLFDQGPPSRSLSITNLDKDITLDSENLGGGSLMVRFG